MVDWDAIGSKPLDPTVVQAWLAVWNESDVFSDASVRHLQSLITDFSRAIFRVPDWSSIDERYYAMTTYTVYFASRSILYAETKIEAETPEQALERALEMAEDEGGNLLDSLDRRITPSKLDTIIRSLHSDIAIAASAREVIAGRIIAAARRARRSGV